MRKNPQSFSSWTATASPRPARPTPSPRRHAESGSAVRDVSPHDPLASGLDVGLPEGQIGNSELVTRTSARAASSIRTCRDLPRDRGRQLFLKTPPISARGCAREGDRWAALHLPVCSPTAASTATSRTSTRRWCWRSARVCRGCTSTASRRARRLADERQGLRPGARRPLRRARRRQDRHGAGPLFRHWTATSDGSACSAAMTRSSRGVGAGKPDPVLAVQESYDPA